MGFIDDLLSGLRKPEQGSRGSTISGLDIEPPPKESFNLFPDQEPFFKPLSTQEDLLTPQQKDLRTGQKKPFDLFPDEPLALPKIVKRRPAETIDINELPDSDTSIAKAAQKHLSSLGDSPNRIDGLEESIMVSTGRSKRIGDRFKAIANKKEGDDPKTFSQNLSDFADILEETLPGLNVRTGKSFAGGAVGSAVGTLRGLEALTGKDIIHPEARVLNLQEALRVENPTFADKLSGGFGSTITFFIPGLGVAKGLSAVSKAGKVANFFARAGGVGVMSGLEALAESGEIYEQAQLQGATKEEAAKVANHGAALNMIVLGITNSIGLGGAQKTILKRMLASSPMEAVQEALQTAIGNYELGAEGMDIWDGALESGIIGAIVGAVVGGASEGFSSQRTNTLEGKADGVPGDLLEINYFEAIMDRAKRDGVIGENRLTQLKPVEPIDILGGESREANLTGPEARNIVNELIQENKAIESQRKEGESQDPTILNAIQKAEQAADVISNPETRGTVQKITKKQGFRSMAELSPQEFIEVITEAREQAPSAESQKIFNDILKAGDQVTEDIDSDTFTKVLGENIEQRQSTTIPLEQRKKLTDDELVNFLTENRSPTDVVFEENGKDVTVQDVMDVLQEKPGRKDILAKRQEIKENFPPGEVRDQLLKEVNEELKKAESPTVAARRDATEQKKSKEIAQKEAAKVKKELQQVKKNKIVNEIRHQLQKTRPKKQSGKPVGNFTAPVQKALDLMREASRLTAQKARERINENLSKVDKETGFLDPKVALENRILQTFSGLQGKSIVKLQQIRDEVSNMEDTGKMMRMLETKERDTQYSNNRRDGLNALTGGKGIPAGANTTGIQKLPAATVAERVNNWLTKHRRRHAAWKDIAVSLSTKDKQQTGALEKIMDMHETKTAEKVMNQKTFERIRSDFMNAFGLKNDSQMHKQMVKDSKEISLGEFVNGEGATVEIKFTKQEARKRWMELQDPTLQETILEGMGYTQEIVQSIEDFLTPQDKKYAESQLKFYRERYNEINEVYREIYGVDLPFNEFYSPIQREGFKGKGEDSFGDFLSEIPFRDSIAPGSLKSREDSVLVLKKMSDTDTMSRHTIQMNHFITHALKVQELRSFFDNPTIRKAIKLHHGGEIISVIDHFINDFTRSGMAVSNRLSMLDKLRGNFYKGSLAIRPIIAVKQLTSIPAFVDNMPVAKWVQYSAEFWLNPMGNTRTLYKDSVSLQSRGQTMERDMQTAMRSNAFGRFKRSQKASDMIMLNVQMGDQGAIVIGGWPYYKYLTKDLGLSHEEAIETFEKQFESTQQSGDTENLNYWQRRDSMTKLFTMFLSTPTQYMNAELNAIQNALAKKTSVGKMAKTLFIYQVLLPTIFQLVTNLGRWDDKEQAAAVIMGPFSSIFIAGQIMDATVRTALGVFAFDAGSPITSIHNGLLRAMENMSEKDIDAEDIEDAVLGIMDSAGKLSGTPMGPVTNFAYGANDVLVGEREKGFYRLMGATKFQAKSKAEDGEKEEEKGPKKFGDSEKKPIKTFGGSKKKPLKKFSD